MGVNFPATHVLVRDTMFYGTDAPRLEITDLLQMMGRAGRGTQRGTAAVLLKSSSGWTQTALEEGLEEEQLPTLTSAFEQDEFGSGDSKVATKIAALLGRWDERGGSEEEITTFFSESLSGDKLARQVRPALQWLRREKVVYEEEDRFFLTALGEYAVKAFLPLHVASGWAQLMRDLLTIDPEDDLLRAWRPLDHILLLEILYNTTSSIRRFSQALEDQVHAWCEQHPDEQPILFREWMSGTEGNSNADQVFGSLGVELPRGKSPDEQSMWARQQAYKAMFRTMVIYERSQGKNPSDIARTYNTRELEGVEEKWRDNLMWLLAGVAQILEIRSFYYHLRENCEASPRRVRRVKGALREMRRQAYSLQNQLKYLSPLGGALRQMRRVIKSDNGRVGIQSIRRLEEQGITSLRELAAADVEDLKELGVTERYAKQVRNYLKMRTR
jgi:superfamily II helicase